METVTLELPPELAAQLREYAGWSGQTLEQFLVAAADKEAAVMRNPIWVAAIRRIRSRTPEEVAATRAEAFAHSPPPRPLPEGKTLEDVLVWPGDETDEQIRVALERLS
jgi:hypothetical protein